MHDRRCVTSVSDHCRSTTLVDADSQSACAAAAVSDCSATSARTATNASSAGSRQEPNELNAPSAVARASLNTHDVLAPTSYTTGSAPRALGTVSRRRSVTAAFDDQRVELDFGRFGAIDRPATGLEVPAVGVDLARSGRSQLRHTSRTSSSDSASSICAESPVSQYANVLSIDPGRAPSPPAPVGAADRRRTRRTRARRLRRRELRLGVVTGTGTDPKQNDDGGDDRPSTGHGLDHSPGDARTKPPTMSLWRTSAAGGAEGRSGSSGAAAGRRAKAATLNPVLSVPGGVDRHLDVAGVDAEEQQRAGPAGGAAGGGDGEAGGAGELGDAAAEDHLAVRRHPRGISGS